MPCEQEQTVQSLIDSGILFPIDDGNHGSIHPKVSDYVEEGVPFLMASDLVGSRVDLENCARLSLQTASSLRKGFARDGDVLLTHKGTIGRTAILEGCGEVGAILTPQITFYRIKDSNRLDARYLRFYFNSTPFQSLLATWSGAGSTRAYLGITAQCGLPIAVPSIQDQRSIANILGTLDNKIELNRKTRDTHGDIAKVLFKSWFVDFDPVRAKAEGRPTGLPEEISDLFPDSFEDSELGEVPSGWGCRQLREMIESIKDRQEDRLLEEFSATVTGIEPRDDRFKKNLAKSSNKNRVAHEGDLVFGLSRRVINFGRMPRSIGAFSPVYEVFRLLPGAPISTKFIEKQIRQRMSEFMIILKPAAREGQAIDREILLDQSVPIAPGKVIIAFEALADLVENRIKSIVENINVLEQMRDALLPRLISGELRVPDAEKMLEEVGI